MMIKSMVAATTSQCVGTGLRFCRRLREVIKRDVAKWQDVVKSRNIKPEG